MQKYFTKINIETKSIDETGMFAGYASMFNVVDSMGDAILPGAFRETLKENQSIKLLWQHDATQPIGYFTKIEETLKGLYVEAKILTDLPKGKEAYNLICSGVIDSLSIGFQVEDFFYGNTVRYIKKLKLWEISVVTFPANKDAKITKVNDDELTILSKAADRALRALKEAVG
jgi:uncharacterized protein